MKKQRTGFLAMAIGLVIVALGLSMAEYSHLKLAPQLAVNSQSQTAASTDQGNNVGNTSTLPVVVFEPYQNSKYKYSVQYPSDFILQQQTDGSISFNIPVKDYFRTVLVKDGDIKLVIAPVAATCNSSTIGGANGTSTTMIGSPAGSFQKINGSDVGAGQLYDESFYTLKTGGLCYSVDLVIHSTNGAGFYYSDPAKIASTDAEQTIDKAAFVKVIDQMVSTFNFTK